MSELLVNRGSKRAPRGLFLAKAVSFDVSAGTVDLAAIDADVYFYNCMIMCSKPASYNFGERYIPSFNPDDNEVSYVTSPGDIYCVATYLGSYSNPVVLGFLFPTQTELSIREYGLYIFRHESDVIVIIRGDGTTEFYHPSGSYIKIGEDDVNNVAGSSLKEGGLYPQTADDFRVRKPSDFNARKKMGLFIKMWSGQNITLNKDGDVIVSTGSTSFSIKLDGTTDLSANVVNVNASQINLNKA